MNDVRELLERAAEEAGQPAVSAEVVYARAARVRRRRRVAVSAAAVCAVAAGAFVVPGLSAGGEQAPRTSSVAAPAKPVGNTERARALIKLLPEGVGSVEQVFPEDISQGDAEPEHIVETPGGPLGGLYAVRRGGGVGYLEIGAMVPAGAPGVTNGCAGAGALERTDCVREELPGGRVLTIWYDPMTLIHNTSRQPGPELTARLTFKDGGQLVVRNSTGFEGDAVPGPLLKTPPLTRAQFRALMLRQELLPVK
ncbi:hypothetical protein ABZ456_10775 [Streptomyces sp. NPDC005776]|uniref:hypothetical protein n=1 Tax=Streptomyces sp. NPDC005776 TaxID=3154676 RepID=UPI0033E7211D